MYTRVGIPGCTPGGYIPGYIYTREAIYQVIYTT